MFAVNVEGLIIKDSKLLIGRRSLNEEHAGGKLSLIGGTVEKEGNSNDILENNLKREIMEETGLEVSNFKYVNNTSFVTQSGINVINIVFSCEWVSGDAVVKDRDEISELIWMTFDEVINNKNSPFYLVNSVKIAKQDKILK
ncbi:NUDIX hydrolase [Bacillus cytotoxicus]|uniref:NUDIX hydrolase n=2 Tax=Bacillus cytotoxicus TaxID=580165 RepID=A0AAX2CBE2_9BACI|nr:MULTISPECIES: NUDIX domain-containing protein [Bacillus cereus group]ABS20533.1 NUDIX hydrolase [Bacillus cytotoxicus NVH 391-98]AWC31198.1 NUDIX domain-containing protein [Bacillus cytotoxicus]AWC35240.1 NUDIX domain-containing protein [Bacillus cytotoxicus]AWC43278.1 NUDIX domain-containing protein [Bacillus cytotoxicus]AWC59464.1 NUDIX domain-containing protein [Bacillus cytotoxicus]